MVFPSTPATVRKDSFFPFTLRILFNTSLVLCIVACLSALIVCFSCLTATISTIYYRFTTIATYRFLDFNFFLLFVEDDKEN